MILKSNHRITIGWKSSSRVCSGLMYNLKKLEKRAVLSFYNRSPVTIETFHCNYLSSTELKDDSFVGVGSICGHGASCSPIEDIVHSIRIEGTPHVFGLVYLISSYSKWTCSLSLPNTIQQTHGVGTLKKLVPPATTIFLGTGQVCVIDISRYICYKLIDI